MRELGPGTESGRFSAGEPNYSNPPDGHAGEVVVTLRIVTGSAGESRPEDVLRTIAQGMLQQLRELKGGLVGCAMVQGVEASYESLSSTLREEHHLDMKGM